MGFVETIEKLTLKLCRRERIKKGKIGRRRKINREVKKTGSEKTGTTRVMNRTVIDQNHMVVMKMKEGQERIGLEIFVADIMMIVRK